MEKHKVIGTVIGVLAFILLIVGATYAWFTWRSPENTSVSFTVGGIEISFDAGEDILSSRLRPVLDKEKGVENSYAIKKNITASSAEKAYLNLYLTLETLPNELKHESFKWELYKDNNLIGNGNFKDSSQGDKIILASNQETNSTVSTYILYIWIDGNMDNPVDMGNKEFKFILNADAEIKEETTGADYIESLLASNPTTMNNDDKDHNVRYMGADPNNYVSFNDELWRIIGVFNVKSSEGGQPEKRLKIIRDEPLAKMAWDSANSNDWTKSSLSSYLNGEYYNSLTTESQGLVGDTYWNLGGSSTHNDVTTSMFYERERGTTTYGGQPSTWVGKIGLMYTSDYGYATSGGTTTNRASCLSKVLYNWDSFSDCPNNNYLYNSKFYLWTITLYSSSSDGVFRVYEAGSVSRRSANSSDYSFTPVLYLKLLVQINGGTGTSTDPFTLSM